MPTLYLLDAYALIYRAYYALIRSPRINSRGENTSASFGFVNTLEDILRHNAPDYLAVVFDPAGGTFRHTLYPEYKAQRERTPEDISRAVPVIKDILRDYRIPLIEVPGYEADDVIGTLALRAASAGVEVHMVTPDKDYAQLVAPGIVMHRPPRGGSPAEILGEAEVCAKYGPARPAQVIDLLGLMGDAADNVPGCPGVGEKTATKLIQQFGGIDSLLAASAQLKGALREKVETHAEQIRLSKFLVTIKTDVPITLSLEALRRAEPDLPALEKIFAEQEFSSLLKRKRDTSKASTPKNALTTPSLFDAEPGDDTEARANTAHETLETTPHKYHLVDTPQDASALCEYLLTKQTVAVDTETTDVDPISAKLVGMSFAVEGDEAWYVPVSRETEAARAVVACLRPVLESKTIVKVGQNLKYDLNVLHRYGAQLCAPLFDTMLAHYCVQPEQRHNLDHLCAVYLGYRTIPITALIGTGRAQRTMAEVAPADIVNYACEDAHCALRLKSVLEAEMARSGAQGVFHDIEMPLLPVLARIERNGVCLDTASLSATREQFAARLTALEQEIFTLAGHPFTLTSPRQVGVVLFDELGLNERARKTKTGQYSTGEEVLEALRPKHPIVGNILEHRALKKLIGTYVDALPRLVNPATGRIHTSFNQAVTATGRLSSSNPNLQNIPVRGADGKEIRRAFVPAAGEVFLSADYSQIELRIMAHLSGDERLIADFQAGRDIHAATAARVYHVGVEDVDRDMRRKAKTANFGIIYGISAFGLAERMEVSRAEAKALIDEYFNTYPAVKDYIEQSITRARESGYIETAFGRRRYLPDITSRNAVVRGYAERNAVNAPIQGTAADIIKRAMVGIDRRMQAEGLTAQMILQVHDELNFSCPPAELPRLRTIVKEEMEQAFPLRVPLVAECGEGENWLEAH